MKHQVAKVINLQSKIKVYVENIMMSRGGFRGGARGYEHPLSHFRGVQSPPWALHPPDY